MLRTIVNHVKAQEFGKKFEKFVNRVQKKLQYIYLIWR